jgi:hypothetical protein
VTKPTYRELLAAANIVACGYDGVEGNHDAWVAAFRVVERANSYSKVLDSDSKKSKGLRAEARNPLISNRNLAEWTGLEPATPGVTGPCSNP